jgi:transposase-like protein
MKCTICNKEMTVKAGIRINRTGRYQMWMCNGCGHRQREADVKTPVEVLKAI